MHITFLPPWNLHFHFTDNFGGGEEDLYFDEEKNTFPADDSPDSDDPDEGDGWQHHRPAYVYDAVAERTLQRIREGQAQSQLVNGVH